MALGYLVTYTLLIDTYPQPGGVCQKDPNRNQPR